MPVNIFDKKKSISVKNLENLDFDQHFRKISISVQNLEISILVNIFEKNRFRFKFWKLDSGQPFRKKNPISIQNFENLDFGQNFQKNYDIAS